MRLPLPWLAAILLPLMLLAGCGDDDDDDNSDNDPGPMASLDALLLAAGPFTAWPDADGWSDLWDNFLYADGALFGLDNLNLLPPFADPSTFNALAELAPAFGDIEAMTIADDRTVFLADAGGVIAIAEPTVERLADSPTSVCAMALSPDDETLYAVSNDLTGDEFGLWTFDRAAQAWTHLFDDRELRHLAVDSAGRVFAANDSFVYVFDPEAKTYGIVYENTGTPERVRGLTCGNDQQIYFTAVDQDTDAGLIFIHRPLDGSLSSLSVAQQPSRIAVGSLGDILFADEQGGLYEMPAGGDAQLLTFAGDKIIDLAIDASDHAYAIGAGGNVARIPAGADVSEVHVGGEPFLLAMFD
ncbi:MAG TPA: hypothetical protein PKW95_19605 [bacterium]|nr:hypothetical protein [bacterium]